MKTADIVVGTHYAYIHRPTAYHKGVRSRVRVLATEVEFTIGWGWRAKTHRNGIEVVFVDDKTGRKRPNVTSQVVKPAHIEMTWDAWVVKQAEAQAVEDQVEAHRFKSMVHRTRVRGYLALMGLRQNAWPVDGHYTMGGYRADDSFQLTADELLHVVTTAALHEHLETPPTLDDVKPTVRKVRGEDRYELYVNGLPIGEDHYSQDEAKEIAQAVVEGVKPDADEDE